MGKKDVVTTVQYVTLPSGHAREDKLGHEVDPNKRIFCLRDGTLQSADSLRPLFKKLLVDAGLLHDAHGHARTLYSCRHTYATLRLLHKEVPVHTLAVKMGTSVAKIERHYIHLTACLVVDQLE